ncbi:MAG: hypothetical protein CME43_11540 [Haliea sp.]|nr:hypothetical protein [Haliea sp.]
MGTQTSKAAIIARRRHARPSRGPSTQTGGAKHTVTDQHSPDCPQSKRLLTPLASEALLEVSGPDAVSFLHNQASCDIRQLASDAACYGTFCNPQGRVLADFVALATAPDTLLLRLRAEILERTLDNLRRFAVFSKVQLRNASEDWQLLGIQGRELASALGARLPAFPAAPLIWTHSADAIALRTTGDPDAVELWVRSAAASELLSALKAQFALQADESAWQAATLRQGVARLSAATSGEFLPQQLNYDLIGHINFRKGCYPGQEVIARMHYKGKAKRRMLLMTAPAGTALRAGDALYRAGQAQPAGTVINAARPDSGAQLVLVSTTETAVEDGLLTAAEKGTALALLPLPYAVPFG